MNKRGKSRQNATKTGIPIYVLQDGKKRVTMIASGRLLFVWDNKNQRYWDSRYNIWLFKVALTQEWVMSFPDPFLNISPANTPIEAVENLGITYCPIAICEERQ